MPKTKIVLYLSLRGFPFGLATIQRQLQISKAIKEGGTQVLVISRKGSHLRNTIESEQIQTDGSYEGIDYIYSSGTPLYPKNFIARNFLKVVGFAGELFVIFWNRFTKNVRCVIVGSSNIFFLKYYWLITRVLGIKLIYDYVEYSSSLADRSIKEVNDDKNFDVEFYKYVDALIIISHYLEDHVKNLTSKPYIIIPPIIDFEKFSMIHSKPPISNYFLYCAGTFYMDVFHFVIEAYRKSDSNKLGVSLVLVINGEAEKIDALRNTISDNELIQIISDLPYDSLVAYYKNARALLIPLQENLQDKARFPFKISEYTAAACPIVTSNYGEVVSYFQDGVNALLAKPGDVDDFALKLKQVLADQKKANEIGDKGYQLGKRIFNYRNYSKLLDDFI